MSDAPKLVRQVMDVEHRNIHAGKYFSFGEKKTITTGASLTYGFTTGANEVHVKPMTVTSSVDQLTLAFYRDCSFTGGTLISRPENRNHNSSDLATFFGYNNPTVVLPDIAALQAGGNFGNQPAGDGVEFLSDSAADAGIIATMYGTKTGATTTVTAQNATCLGTSQASFVTTTWQNILGIELDRAPVGTITFREASANATIITFSAGQTSKGIATLTTTSGLGAVPFHDASASGTSPVGIIGYGSDGVLTSSVANLNGTTGEAHGTTIFYDITKVLIGAVPSATNVQVYSNIPGYQFSAAWIPGSTGFGGTRAGDTQSATEEFILKPNSKYVITFLNSSTASNIIAWVLKWYEED